MEPDDTPWRIRGLGWRISASVLAGVGWLAFVILWLAFFASGWSIYQNLAVLLVSLLVLGAVLGLLWVGFGLRMERTYAPVGERPYHGRMGWRRGASGIIWLGWAVFLVLWLLYYADGFNGYQNLAVLIASLIVAGGLSSVIWARWRP